MEGRRDDHNAVAHTPVETFSYLSRPPSSPPLTEEWSVASSGQLVDSMSDTHRGSAAAVWSTLDYIEHFQMVPGFGGLLAPLSVDDRRLRVVFELTGHALRFEHRTGRTQAVPVRFDARKVLPRLSYEEHQSWAIARRREGDQVLSDLEVDLDRRNESMWLRLIDWFTAWYQSIMRADKQAFRERTRGGRPPIEESVVERDALGAGNLSGDVDGEDHRDHDRDDDLPEEIGADGECFEPDEPGKISSALAQRVADVLVRIVATTMALAADDSVDPTTGRPLTWLHGRARGAVPEQSVPPSPLNRAGVLAALRRVILDHDSGALLDQMVASHEIATGKVKPWIDRLMRPTITAELARIDGQTEPQPTQVSRVSYSVYYLLRQVCANRLEDAGDDRPVLSFCIDALDVALRRVQASPFRGPST